MKNKYEGEEEDHTPQEIAEIVKSMPDDRLAKNYQTAKPGTEWRHLLSDEIGKRDGRGRRQR